MASLRGVDFAYRAEVPAVRGVHAELRPGRVTALLGPNASGKSTLLKLLLGQLRPDAGQVHVRGREVGDWSAQELARTVSYIPQRGGSSFGFTVRQMVTMGRYAFGDEAFVDEALRRCDLADLSQRVFGELSGGQQQRAQLARAWAQSRGPSGPADAGGLVLADEPTSNLDLRHVEQAMSVLAGLAAEGRAVLVVLHDLGTAQRWADDVWLMAAGRLVAAGPTPGVLTPERLGEVYGVPLRATEAAGQRLFHLPLRPDDGGSDTLE
jgi:iron complex transport system ATP-binding protein